MSDTKKQAKTKKEPSKKTKTSAVKKQGTKKKISTLKKTETKKTTAPKSTPVTEEKINLEPTTREESLSLQETKEPENQDMLPQTEEKSLQEKKGFFALYLSTWKKSFSIKGRANRSEVILFPLFNIFIFFSLWISSLVISFFFDNNFASFILFAASTLLAFATVPANICLFVRRFHDFNKSGKFALAPFIAWLVLIPCGYLTALAPNIIGPIIFVLAYLVWFTALIWTLMYIAFPGSKGENKYGERPQTKTRIIWLNLLVLFLTIPLYYLLAFISFLNANINGYEETTQFSNNLIPTELQTPLDSAVFPDDSSGLSLPLSNDELDAEVLKMEKFINSLPDETTAPIDNSEPQEVKVKTSGKNLLAPKE